LVIEAQQVHCVEHSANQALWVVCLCAQWCHVCEDYRIRFEQVRLSVIADYPRCQFLWIDVEDQADMLEPLDIDNFPTLLLAMGADPRFLGVITPQVQTLERLVRSAAAEPAASALHDPVLHDLVGRIQAWHTVASGLRD
jgi:hypothetical protein